MAFSSQEEEEVNLQYFCHNCDEMVTEIEYTDDGTLKCNKCNEQYVEIVDPDDPVDTNDQASTNSNTQPSQANIQQQQPPNNPQWQTFRNPNGQQVFYWSSVGNNNNNNNGGANNNLNNAGNAQQAPFNMPMPFLNNINRFMNQAMTGMNRGGNLNFADFGFGNTGAFMQEFGNIAQNGPPPTANSVYDELPEYAYNGPVEKDSDSESDGDGDHEHAAQSETTNESNNTAADEGDETKEADADSKKNRECAICKEKFLKGDLLKELPCTHRYHKDCISPWLHRRNTCPTCRHRLRTDNSMYERMEDARQENRNGQQNPVGLMLNQMFGPLPNATFQMNNMANNNGNNNNNNGSSNNNAENNNNSNSNASNN